MRVERQVRAVNGEVMIEQRTQQFVLFPRPRMRRRPEQAVMHEQEIRPHLDSKPHRRETRVHRSGDTRDCARVFDLQAVRRAIVVADVARRLVYDAMVIGLQSNSNALSSHTKNNCLLMVTIGLPLPRFGKTEREI